MRDQIEASLADGDTSGAAIEGGSMRSRFRGVKAGVRSGQVSRIENLKTDSLSGIAPAGASAQGTSNQGFDT